MDALRELTDRELVRVARVSVPHWLCEANNEGFCAILLSNILWVIWGLHDRAHTPPIFLFERSGASTTIVNVSRILTHSDAHLLDDYALFGLAFAAVHLSSSKPSCAIGDSFCFRLPT
jgi:hypothetical protein